MFSCNLLSILFYLLINGIVCILLIAENVTAVILLWKFGELLHFFFHLTFLAPFLVRLQVCTDAVDVLNVFGLTILFLAVEVNIKVPKQKRNPCFLTFVSFMFWKIVLKCFWKCIHVFLYLKNAKSRWRLSALSLLSSSLPLRSRNQASSWLPPDPLVIS